MKITLKQLRTTISEALVVEAGAKKKSAKKPTKKPAKKSAKNPLKKAGKGRLLRKSDLEKTPAKRTRPETPAMVLAKLVVAFRGAGLKFKSKEKNSGARRMWFNFVQGPGLPPPPRDADVVHEAAVAKVIAALNSVGIKPDGYDASAGSDGTKIMIPGGYVTVTDDHGYHSIGADVVVSLFDGPRAHQEEMGMDTGDMGEPGSLGSEPL
jgi:hypothetical protein